MRFTPVFDAVGDGFKKVFTKPMMLDCGEHGKVRAAFVCSHIVATLQDGKARGLNGERQVHNLNASCDECDALIVRNNNNWSEELMKVTGVEMICENCLSRAAKLNGLEAFQ